MFKCNMYLVKCSSSFRGTLQLYSRKKLLYIYWHLGTDPTEEVTYVPSFEKRIIEEAIHLLERMKKLISLQI